MLTSILNLKGVKVIPKSEQSIIKGSFGNCGVFMCTLESEGCQCYYKTLYDYTIGSCVNGQCKE
ncbi:hypothetical protein KORDIASMS9_04452 [Kordia sp. SMS9]|nr:hypothetical protein KORDIASMS9_04452 [Kordia sp. SMS9]